MENNSIPQSISFFGPFGTTFSESIKTIYKIKKLLLLILLLASLSLSQLEFSQEYIQVPFLRNLMLELLKNQWMLHNINRKMDLIGYGGALDDIDLEALFINQLTLALSSIIKLICCVAIVSSTHEAYTSYTLGPKGMFLKIRTSWKNALLTSFCLFLTYSGILIVHLVSNGIITILVSFSWSYLFFGAINLTLLVFYLYGAVLWKVSIVVSVLERDLGGFNAIIRATELIEGIWPQASVLMVPSFIAKAYVDAMIYAIPNSFRWRNKWLDILVYLRNGSDCFFYLFLFVVYTVFYHEIRASLDQREVKSPYRPKASGEA